MRRNLPLLLIRILVGLVFVTEGLLKFLEPAELGSGRFAHLGLPAPHLLAPFVGAVEILSGVSIALNLYTGEAAVLLLCVIVTALVTTKIPILLGHALGPFGAPRSSGRGGLLAFLHESRTDLAMLFCLIALLIDAGVRFRRGKPLYQR